MSNSLFQQNIIGLDALNNRRSNSLSFGLASGDNLTLRPIENLLETSLGSWRDDISQLRLVVKRTLWVRPKLSVSFLESGH